MDETMTRERTAKQDMQELARHATARLVQAGLAASAEQMDLENKVHPERRKEFREFVEGAAVQDVMADYRAGRMMGQCLGVVLWGMAAQRFAWLAAVPWDAAKPPAESKGDA